MCRVLNTGSPGKSPSLCTLKIHAFHGCTAMNFFFFLWLNMIYQYGIWLTCSPLWAYATVYLSIHQLMDNIWMVYSLWLLWVMLLWNLFLHGVNIFSFYGYIQKSEISGSYGYSIFNFWGTDKLLFQSGCTILQQYIFNNIFQQYIFQHFSTIYEDSFFPHPLQHLLLFSFLIISTEWMWSRISLRLIYILLGASLVPQKVKHPPAMRDTWVQFLGQDDPLEKEMTIHSSTLAWKIPWMEELDRLKSMGWQRVGHDWAISLSFTFNHVKQYFFCVILGHLYIIFGEMSIQILFLVVIYFLIVEKKI